MKNQEVLNDFGKRIRLLRLQQELSQEELSQKTGFHRTYIGMIERGERNISLCNITIFAKVFKMSISELLKLEKVNSSHSFSSYNLKIKK